MALNNKKPAFGLDMEARLSKTSRPHTHTDTHTDTDTYTEIQENKTKRTYGLVKPSVFDKVTAHAKATGTTFNDIVCKLLDEYIDRHNL